MNKYSFWLVPTNETRQKLQTVVEEYAKIYDSPTFVPHVTICSPIESTDEEVVEAVKRAVADTNPFEVKFADVEFSTTYFQCVFVRAKTTAALLQTHLAIKDAFHDTREHVFMPHASLVYGNFAMKPREKIAQEITLSGLSFFANAVTIVRADTSDPKDWDVVAEVEL
ncbi:MAG: 2'-5' RNA ligase family protein [bacterium]|nr:2'-5' RNA ligase family protein [bacterium]